MNGADIKLTLEGKVVLKDGDFAIDEQLDVAFANRMLRTGRGSWEFDPDIGIGIHRFAGRANTEETAVELQKAIDDGLRAAGISSRTTVYPTASDTVAIKVAVFTTQGVEVLSFSFSYQDGLTTYVKNENENTGFALRPTLNKYDRRNLA